MDKAILNKYTVVVGLEIHAQLLTKSKIYSGDSTAFGAAPNTNVSAITLAHPGTLPKLNKRVAELAIRMGLACKSDISRLQIFDRKNYFYPDLPKGYQITQDRTPICKGGAIVIPTKDGAPKAIQLNRIHIEEDAGKSIHLAGEMDTRIDYNRAGVPLIEIVTEPVLRSSAEAYALMTEVRRLVRYLEICDGNMEEGSLRCDANVSLMLKGATQYGKKVEVKNMNSVRNVQRAIDHEVERQVAILERGEMVVSETRTFDAASGKTFSMRTKEELNDYRYFPDPDLSPLAVTDDWLNTIRSAMPVLPWELRERFVSKYALSEYDAGVLTDTKEFALYFEDVCRYTSNFKGAANWMIGPVKSVLNEHSIDIQQFPIAPQRLALLVAFVDEGKVNFAVASQKIFPALLNGSEAPLEVATRLNLMQDSDDSSILPIVEEVIRIFPLKVEEYKNGKRAIITMFMGEIMKRSKGKADPKVATRLLELKLNEK
ncbi:MAG TPA: Asp-tRNA(Asn)/Glu-tRNA(Gln) amidotransferase subunit GatB [Cyclobacteriaceae bacterium]|nr:Asp-tRNA(Asn)/Glu-tRNA(Gln) amidotransferase subunit GatB [Cyclobacteriaceae bacterium]